MENGSLEDEWQSLQKLTYHLKIDHPKRKIPLPTTKLSGLFVFVSRNLHLSYLGASLYPWLWLVSSGVYPSIIGAPGMSEGLAEVWQHSQARLQLRKVSQMLGLHWKSQEFGIRSQIFLKVPKMEGFLTDWTWNICVFFLGGGGYLNFRYLKCLVKMWSTRRHLFLFCFWAPISGSWGNGNSPYFRVSSMLVKY